MWNRPFRRPSSITAAKKTGFSRPMRSIPDYFQQAVDSDGTDGQTPPSPFRNWSDRGQEILVQVTKEETGTKGVALTTYLSLAGSFLVLTPGEPMVGISRKIEAEEERSRSEGNHDPAEDPRRDRVHRPNRGDGKTKRELAKNLENLLRLWEEIRNRAIEQPAPSLDL